jgi:photosystem II stability/assembly factor-like uncharacterized protein
MCLSLAGSSPAMSAARQWLLRTRSDSASEGSCNAGATVAVGHRCTGNAEMTTSTGAVYYTKNAGLNWKAQVSGGNKAADTCLSNISGEGIDSCCNCVIARSCRPDQYERGRSFYLSSSAVLA